MSLVMPLADHEQSLSDRHPPCQYTFTPIRLIDRSLFRLSDIEYGPLDSGIASGSQLRAHVPILDLPSTSGPLLLLARLGRNGTLCLIERDPRESYLYCALRSDVKEEQFLPVKETKPVEESGPSTRENGRPALEEPTSQTEKGIRDVRKGVATSPKRPKNRRGAAARLSILAEKQGQVELLQPKEPPDNEVSQLMGVADSAGVECNVESQSSLQTPSQIASDAVLDPAAPTREPQEVVHEALMKALYTSQAALAHFTKSTLARTRAAFRASTETNLIELAQFYRTRITTSKKLDLKYRETVPKILENLKLRHLSGELGVSPSKPAKKARSWPKKVGKNGLYSGEEEFLQSSWCHRDQKREALQTESAAQAIQDFVKELRNRETQLQIILILEILALDATLDSTEQASSQSTKPEAEGELAPAPAPSPAKKKKDLRPALDVLVDRLCIYQSVGFTDSSAKDPSGAPLAVTDKLRDFCCNVILPFYLHKLPDIVKEMSTKLGGPDILSKKEMMAKAKSGPAVKAGPKKPPPPKAPPKSLERLLKEERAARRPPPPSLPRAASFSSVMNGRNSAESSRPNSRGTLQRSASLSNRVDLVAQFKLEEAKMRKVAELSKRKEDLAAAINALKKPNRSLAGKEIMVEAEKRKLGFGPGSRKAAPLVRSESDPCLGVQIAATPRKIARPSRLDDAAFLPASRQGLAKAIEDSPEDIAIPSSALRGASSTILSETPPRVPPKKFDSAHLQIPSQTIDLTSSPLAKRTSSAPIIPWVAATPPSKPRSSAFLQPASVVKDTPPRMSMSNKPVLFTPVAKPDTDMEKIFRSAPLVTQSVAQSMDRVMAGSKPEQTSIYETLGWDDEEDELL